MTVCAMGKRKEGGVCVGWGEEEKRERERAERLSRIDHR